ncbi:hypothetical protein GE061_017512 [Apolygus lucorum]|uniref:Uncharacterized protein n=1 Tax=Apolygus lucorum TaxID=248454 RepID=A0A8S9XBD4_APOLU|nr:hypothetical protein GE061_017512 [Apolygus lucorum]
MRTYSFLEQYESAPEMDEPPQDVIRDPWLAKSATARASLTSLASLIVVMFQQACDLRFEKAKKAGAGRDRPSLTSTARGLT